MSSVTFVTFKCPVFDCVSRAGMDPQGCRLKWMVAPPWRI